MSLKLYFDLLSQPSRALYIFLKVNKIPFENKLVNLAKLEHQSPEYEQLNPFKKVPIIEHNGFILTESVGILRYLCREFNVEDHWYPKNSKIQSKVDEYLEWQHLNTRMHCAAYFFLAFLNPMIRGRAPEPKKLAVYQERMENCLDLIENIWLKDKPFLIGNTITVADLLGSCEVEQPRMCGYDPRKGRPRLAAWLDRVKKETSPHYEEAHKFLNTIAQSGNKNKVGPKSTL